MRLTMKPPLDPRWIYCPDSPLADARPLWLYLLLRDMQHGDRRVQYRDVAVGWEEGQMSLLVGARSRRRLWLLTWREMSSEGLS